MRRKSASPVNNKGIHTGSLVLYEGNKYKVAYYNRILSPNDVYVFKHHKRGCVRWTSIERLKLTDVELWVPELS